MKPKKNEPEQPPKKKLWAAADKLRKNMESARIITEKLKTDSVPKTKRPKTVSISGISLPLPNFFPSVSSVKTNLPPIEYLRIIHATGHPQVLVSAYDLQCQPNKTREKFNAILQRIYNKGRLILVDSGNYESYWKTDRRWKFKDYINALESNVHHLAFSFDEQSPPKSSLMNIQLIEQRVTQALKALPRAAIVPIIHDHRRRLPQVAEGVVKRLQPILLAIPERALGDGIIERTRTLVRIRQRLNKLDEYIPIHLLGTGNPLSILLYTAYGADTFDGLDWCQTTVDYSTGLLYHFQQREFFGKQSPFSSSKKLSYNYATLAHNLLFYRIWMEKIQLAIEKGELRDLMLKVFSREFLRAISSNSPSILS